MYLTCQESLYFHGRERQVMVHRYFSREGDGNVIDQLKERLLRKQSDLERLAVLLHNCILNAPEGFLRISTSGGRLQYHQIEDNGGTRARTDDKDTVGASGAPIPLQLMRQQVEFSEFGSRKCTL